MPFFYALPLLLEKVTFSGGKGYLLWQKRLPFVAEKVTFSRSKG
jgi:hypothetical protein